MLTYIVNYLDDEGRMRNKLVYARSKEAAMKLIDGAIGAHVSKDQPKAAKKDTRDDR